LFCLQSDEELFNSKIYFSLCWVVYFIIFKNMVNKTFFIIIITMMTMMMAMAFPISDAVGVCWLQTITMSMWPRRPLKSLLVVFVAGLVVTYALVHYYYSNGQQADLAQVTKGRRGRQKSGLSGAAGKAVTRSNFSMTMKTFLLGLPAVPLLTPDFCIPH
jgi:hypothetical protein